MTHKHTPSPWLWRPKSDSVHASSETHPYGEYMFAFKEECSPTDADLSLILAAPELLEAAMAFAAPFDGIEVVQDSEIAKARAAIAKATGEA